MKCDNCGAAVPRGSTVCPECGVFTGDEPPKPAAIRARRAGSRAGVLIALLIVAGLGAGGWWWWTRYGQIPEPDAGPVRVVHDRPGGNVKEAEAALVLRRHLAMKADCLALISRGYSNGYYSFDAVDSCQRTKLGRWRVDAKSRAVSR